MDETYSIETAAPISSTWLQFEPRRETTLVPLWLIHAYLYYELNSPIISDHEFDALGQAIGDLWDHIEHRHKSLIQDTKTGFYLVGRFPEIVKRSALQLKQETQGMINVRKKGQRAERMIIDLLQPLVNEAYSAAGRQPPLLQRNLMQSDRGGFDIVGLDWLAVEVKHHENLGQYNLDQFWAQTKRQAGPGQLPVLFYRRNNVAWRVQTFGYLMADKKRVKTRVDISLDAFLVFFRTRLTECLTSS